MSILFDPNQVPLPPDEGPETVGQFTARVRDALEDAFPQAWVVGEVSNLKRHGSGHVFFTLKDERASLRCVMWKSAAGRLPPELADGVQAEVRGHLSVFDAAGQYQLYASSVKARGVGPLEVAFRRLKEKLAAEGLFDEARKRPLPPFPRCIGVVTSPTGAAVRDIFQVLGRRWPAAQIVLAAARVQGEGAAAEIVRGIENLNRLGGVDVMIIGRGGGSLEDLWPFNEESVARAVFASAAPVVSAVGHETDFSISDFVADVRAPTPSAAAELVAPDRRQVAADLAHMAARLSRALRHGLDAARAAVTLLERHRFFRYPQELVLVRVQRLEDLASRLIGGAREHAAGARLRAERAGSRLAEHAPRAAHAAAAAALEMAAHRLREAQRTLIVHRWGERLTRLAGRLDALDPDRVLARGYSRTVLARTGATLKRAADARLGDVLRTHLAEGDLESRVEDAPPSEDSARSPRPARGRKPRGGREDGPTLFG
jgi:exodeoxyribonuclease VII large subunit